MHTVELYGKDHQFVTTCQVTKDARLILHEGVIYRRWPHKSHKVFIRTDLAIGG